MKKIYLFLIFAFAMFSFAYSQPVSVQTAQSVANKVLQQASRSSGVLRATAQPLQLVYQATPSQLAVQPSFYVFSDNSSFVIVSGDSRAMPVLGYSDNSAFDAGNIPPNMAWWLSEYAKQIEFAVQNDIAPSQEVESAWKEVQQTGIAASASSTNAVSPLLSTTWNQSAPYWDLCPNQYYTGCVATATAQIMKYYNYPASRTVAIPAYTTRTNKISVPEVPGDTYDWGNMLNSYGSANSTQKTAVAKLMYHVGASVKMDYASDGSGAYSTDVPVALTTYFNYDASIRYKQRDYCTANEWHTILRAELDAGRPVYYSGSSSTGSGHAFVCDGYTSNDYFHFNWGWGGTHNGDFLTSALNPGTGGAGAGAGVYNLKQAITYNIKPNAGGTSVGTYELGINTTFTSTANSVNYNESFTVKLDIVNISTTTFRIGQVGVALVDNSGNIVSVLQTRNINGSLAAGYYYTNTWDYICSVPSSVPAGTYTLRAVANTYPSDGNGWYFVAAKSDGTGALEIAVASGCLTPTAIQASNVSDSKATITWTPAGNETQWDFQYSTDQTFAGATSETLSTASKNLTGLISGTDYYIRVRAACASSNSNWKTGSFITALCDPAEQCIYTLIARDSYGDGWNNSGHLSFKQDGIEVATATVLSSDGKNDVTFTIALCPYKLTIVEYIVSSPNGAYFNEVSFELKDASGTPIFAVVKGNLGTNSAMGLPNPLYRFTSCANTWTPQPSSTAWNNPANWTPQSVPPATSRAIIPKNASTYPILTAPTTIGEILFEPGAELGRQDLLTYNKAFVQLDFSNESSRSRWQMLTNPLQELFMGDMTFGGLPGMDIKAFVTETDQSSPNYEQGVWKSLPAGYTHQFNSGDNFELWLGSDHPTETKGLKHSSANGIITLPHFENSEAHNVHWTHDYNSSAKVSTFHGWEKNGDNYVRKNGTNVSTTRNLDKAYKLTETVNGKFSKQLDFGYGVNRRVYFAAAGNPFMSSIDFNRLQENNSSLIGETYWVWNGPGSNNGGGYVTYNKTAGQVAGMNVSLTNILSPMQSFIVERKAGSTGTEIIFDIATVSASKQGGGSAVMKASAQSNDLLEIIASTPQSAFRAVIASHKNGDRIFNSKDSRRFSAGINSLPDIYMLKPDAGNNMVAVTANIMNEIKEESLIPLAIATTYEGPVTLSFTGMDTYNARIFFVDTDAPNKKGNELTGQARYEYTFNYVPEKVKGTVVANEKRFFIRLSPTNLTGIDFLAAPNNILIYNRQDNTIQVVSGELIQQISVFNLQGRSIYGNASVNAYEHSITGLAPGIYVVKAASKQEVKTMKIIVK